MEAQEPKKGKGLGLGGGGDPAAGCMVSCQVRTQPGCPLGGERATVISSSAESSGAGCGGGSLLYSSSLFVLPPTNSPPLVPPFLPYPEAAFCFWLESVKAQRSLHDKPSTFGSGFVFIHSLLLILIIPQGRYFCLHFIAETEMARFQRPSLSTSLLPPGKLVES